MKNKKVLIISLSLLVLVMVVVSFIDNLLHAWPWMEPFMPMIVLTGFFTFLVATSLFVYVVISNLKK